MPLFTNQLQRILLSKFWIWLANIYLAITLGNYAMQLNLSLQYPTNSPNLKQAFQTHSPDSQPLQKIDLTSLLNAHLFGKTIASTPSSTSIISPNPSPKPSPSNLKLHGIYYSSHAPSSLAILSRDENTPKLYKIGDAITPTTQLQHIAPKQVTLLTGQQQHTLSLIPLDSQTSEPVSLPSHSSTDNNYPIDAQETLSPDQLLGKYQQQLKTNPAQLLSLFQASPITENGQFIGYRLQPGKNPELLNKFDLQPGDIITAVNGLKLDSPLAGLKLLEQLATTTRLDLQIKRNEQIIPLYYSISSE